METIFKVGQKLWEVKINNPKSGKSLGLYDEGCFVKEHKIIGISPYKICVDTPFFQTFSLNKSTHDTMIDEVTVRIATNETFFPNGIFVTVFSSKKPTDSLFKKMISEATKKVSEKYGFLFGNVEVELNEIVRKSK